MAIRGGETSDSQRRAPAKPRRLIVRFPDRDAYDAANALEANALSTPVLSSRRHFMSVEVPPTGTGGAEAERFTVGQLGLLQRHYGAEVLPDYQYDLNVSDIFD